MTLTEQLQNFIGKFVGEVATGMPAPVNAVTGHQEFKNACTIAGRALISYGATEAQTLQIEPCSGAQALEGALMGLALIAEKVGKNELKELIQANVPGVAGAVAAGVVETVL